MTASTGWNGFAGGHLLKVGKCKALALMLPKHPSLCTVMMSAADQEMEALEAVDGGPQSDLNPVICRRHDVLITQ